MNDIPNRGTINKLVGDLEHVINYFGLNVYAYDLEGNVISASDAQGRVVGFERGVKVVGLNVYDIAKKDGNSEAELKLLIENNKRIARGETIVVTEKMIVKGRHCNFLSYKKPLFDEHNEIIGVTGISFPLDSIDGSSEDPLIVRLQTGESIFQTAKLLQEGFSEDETGKNNDLNVKDTLAKAQYFFNQIIERIPAAVYWQDVRGNFIGSNAFAAKLIGCDSWQDIIGKNIHTLCIDKSKANDFYKKEQEVLKTGKEVVCEESWGGQNDQKEVYLSHRVPLKSLEGAVIGVLGISFNIQNQKNLEALKIKNATLEAKGKSLELLAASVAHELRTPLATIKMGAKALENDLETLFEAYANVDKSKLGKSIPNSRLSGIRKMLPNINTAVRSANNIIDLLVSKSGLSAIDTRKFKKCSIANCVNAALDEYPLNDEQRSLIHWQPGGFDFQGDEALFKHVIFNLLKNSLYYVKAASKGDIQIWTEEGDEYNVLHFKDTGQGIPKNVLPHIFEHSFTTLSHGTGVGLAFSEMVMQAMAGKIICSSELGVCTEFTMYFPKIL